MKVCFQLENLKLDDTMHTISDIRENVSRCAKWQDFSQAVSQKHMKSRCSNIREYVLDRQIKRHENDAMSVSILVREIHQEPFDPILIYKPQGLTLEEHPTLMKNLFVLVVQKFQMKLYRKFCSKIVCILYTQYYLAL